MNSTSRPATRQLNRLLHRLCLLAALLPLLTPQPAHAATVSWIGASGDWNDPTNWSTSLVPGPTDDVLITKDGTYTVTFNADATVSSLRVGASSGTQTFEMAGGILALNGASAFDRSAVLLLRSVLTGSGDVTITGTLDWTAGYMEGSGKTIIASGATLNLSGNDTKGFTRTVENAGTVN